MQNALIKGGVANGDVSELQEWLRNLPRTHGITKTKVAEEIGASAGTIRRFASNKDPYTPGPELLAKLEEYRNRIEGYPVQAQPFLFEDPKDKLEFTMIENVRLAVFLCHECARRSIMGMLLGYSGSGKSTALRYYAERRPDDVVYISADPTLTRKELLREIAEKLGESASYGTSAAIRRKVVRSLTARPRLLIIDEASALIKVGRPGDSLEKIEVIRAVYDQVHQAGGRCGIVLAGIPELAVAILDGPPSLAQLRSRVRRMVRLNPPSKEDIDQLLSGFNIASNAFALLVERAVDTDNGGLRWLETTVNASIDLVGPGGLITKEVVKEVDSVLIEDAFDL